ncbi:MAG TPA: hypothetical protein VF003_20005 [Pseudonocardiaceae bacterium]
MHRFHGCAVGAAQEHRQVLGPAAHIAVTMKEELAVPGRQPCGGLPTNRGSVARVLLDQLPHVDRLQLVHHGEALVVCL